MHVWLSGKCTGCEGLRYGSSIYHFNLHSIGRMSHMAVFLYLTAKEAGKYFLSKYKEKKKGFVIIDLVDE